MKLFNSSLFKKSSLTFRLSLGITILIMFIMGTAGIATFMRDRDMFIEKTYSRGWSTVETIQTMAAAPLKNGNIKLLNKLTSQLADDAFIKRAVITDKSGNIIAHNKIEHVGSSLKDINIKKVLSNKEKHVGQLYNKEGTVTALTFSAPVKSEKNKNQGYIYLAADLTLLQNYLQETIQRLILQFVLASIAGMILTRLIILRSVNRPVQSLVKANEQLANGNFSQKVDINTRDELGTLAKSFNGMTDQLEFLFQSIRKTVSDISSASSSIVKQTDNLKDTEYETDSSRPIETAKEINTTARRLTRMSDKLNALALQFKTRDGQ
ncbi:MAG: cell wall metabolism sensor histidine kinase WalK [Clostridiales bacterium]|nr:cell wall metabolism sensor histidine kinase WalK [Clostridiales bacterium]MCF8023058.1 cell wall metabolism sensor histidine kinase WalK [Clostridiales bacterium]